MKTKRNLFTMISSCLLSATLAFAFSSCGNFDNNSTNSSEPTADGWGTTFTIETAYAKAQDLGYTGSLEEFIDSISGKDGADGKDGKDGVGIASISFTSNMELVITLTNDSTVNLGKIIGEKGDKGDTGEKGDKGDKGDTGAQGPQGEKGDKGDTGEKGDKGDTGEAGYVGAQGPQGEKGDTGATIAKMELTDGYLVITLTDGTVLPPVALSTENLVAPQENFLYEKIYGQNAYRVAGIGTVSDYDLVIPATYKGLPVTEIKTRAFFTDTYTTSNIRSLTISENVLSIGRDAFYGCENLESVVFGENSALLSIGELAFGGCHNLQTIVIPKSVTSIHSIAFHDCTSLTHVYYQGTSEEWTAMNVNDTYLANATKYYYSETEPTESGNYWHYVEGVPTVW